MKNCQKIFLLFALSALFSLAGFLGDVNAAIVDIKANGSDSPTPISYNSSVALTWTSSCTSITCTTCTMDSCGFWVNSSYLKTVPPSGSEIINNLTASKTYTVVCSSKELFGSFERHYYCDSGDDSVTVNVLPNIPVDHVTLNVTSQTLEVGQTYQLIATVFPDNASNKNVTWYSLDLDGKVVGVNSNGKVTALGPGNAVIGVFTQDGNKIAEDAITVSAAPSLTPTVNIMANGKTGLITVSPNAPVNLTWTTANVTYCHASGYWEGSKSINSGNETILGLTSTATFVLTCEGPNNSVASSQVTVNVSSVSIPVASVTVSPPSATISSAQGILLTATVAPSSATNKNVTWSSGDSSIATVDSTGDVEGVAAGTATITATAADGSGKSGISIITVTSVQALTVDLKADGSDDSINVNENSTTVLSWSVSTNATSCTASSISGNWVGSKDIHGGPEEIFNGTISSTYTLACNGPGGPVSDSVTVNVVPSQNVSVQRVAVSPVTATLPIGGTIQLEVTIVPDSATNKNVTWTSGNTAFATVDSNGLVKGIAAGSVNITARTQDGGKTAMSTLKIVPPSPCIVVITANEKVNSDTVAPNSRVTIAWEVVPIDQTKLAQSCVGSGGSTGWPGAKSRTSGMWASGAITSSVVYNITCQCYDGSKASDSVAVNVIGANGAVGLTLSADPNPVDSGNKTTLTWIASNINSCVASGDWSGSKASTNGSHSEQTGTLKASTAYAHLLSFKHYTLTCQSQSGPISKSVEVSINVPPSTGTGTGTGSTGTGSTGTGSSSGGSTGSTGSGSTGSSGSGSSGSGTGSSGGSSGTGGSTGAGAVAMPTVDIKANDSNGPLAIADNGSVTLTWTSSNATSCIASGGWSGTKSTSGSQTISNIATSKTYTLACSGGSNIASDSVTVNTASSPWLATIYPNGQETLTEGDTINITWLANNLTSSQTMSVSIERFNDDGTNCGKKNIGTTPANQESFSWIIDSESGWQDVPDSCSAPFKYKIYIESQDSSNNLLSAESVNFFQIVPAPVAQEQSVVDRLLNGGQAVLQKTGNAIRQTASNIVSYFNDFIVNPIKNLFNR